MSDRKEDNVSEMLEFLREKVNADADSDDARDDGGEQDDIAAILLSKIEKIESDELNKNT